jgi:peptidoglycan/LPS O-acetylase OafA/YrhL
MKRRFAVLDGLRGIAAIAVVAYHAGIALNLRGFLTVKGDPAVDLFFCISGFVLAFAHDTDIVEGRLTAIQFAVTRWLRFLPILALGAALGLMAILFDPTDYPLIYENNADVVSFSTKLAVLSLFLIPISLKSQLVFANNVYWSLCVELIVNIAYALQGNYLRQKYIYAIWLLSALVLASLYAWFRSVHIIPDAPLSSFGCLIRGFASFFAGVIVFRVWHKGFRAPQVNPWYLIATVSVPLVLPYSAPWFQVPFDAFFILLIFPLVVWFAASSITPFERVFSIVGEASFPLYATHLPLLYFAKVPFVGAATGTKLSFVLAFAAVMVALSVAIAFFYEMPTRALIRTLRRKLGR